MRTKIYKVGCEIEGEFSAKFLDELNGGIYGRLTIDGSIRPCSEDVEYIIAGGKTSEHKSLNMAEFRVEPFYITSQKKKRVDMFQLFQDRAEEGQFHWNKTCGFHVHVSFKPAYP